MADEYRIDPATGSVIRMTDANADPNFTQRALNPRARAVTGRSLRSDMLRSAYTRSAQMPQGDGAVNSNNLPQNSTVLPERLAGAESPGAAGDIAADTSVSGMQGLFGQSIGKGLATGMATSGLKGAATTGIMGALQGAPLGMLGKGVLSGAMGSMFGPIGILGMLGKGIGASVEAGQIGEDIEGAFGSAAVAEAVDAINNGTTAVSPEAQAAQNAISSSQSAVSNFGLMDLGRTIQSAFTNTDQSLSATQNTAMRGAYTSSAMQGLHQGGMALGTFGGNDGLGSLGGLGLGTSSAQGAASSQTGVGASGIGFHGLAELGGLSKGSKGSVNSLGIGNPDDAAVDGVLGDAGDNGDGLGDLGGLGLGTDSAAGPSGSATGIGVSGIGFGTLGALGGLSGDGGIGSGSSGGDPAGLGPGMGFGGF